METASNHAVLASLISSDTQIEIVRRVIARARLDADNISEGVELAMDLLVSFPS